MRRLFVALAVAGSAVLAPQSAVAFVECGAAAWYAMASSRTASGEPMNPDALTAAHRTLPFGTRVQVTNLRNGRSVAVRINDRGPFSRGRVIDVSRAAAAELGFIGAGTTRVRLRASVTGQSARSISTCS